MKLILKDISKNYHKARGITKVTLTIEEGNLYLFVGENGSGKSTTIKVISKVIFPDTLKGFILNEFKQMIYLPDKRNYPKLLKTSQFLQYYLGKEYQRETTRKMMLRYQIPNQIIGTLSKGMIQKLGIIQCLLSKGDLYLFDEPTDGLDTTSIQLFKEDLKNLLIQKKTIIISTHSKGIYKELAHKVFQFKEGICNEKK